MSVRELSVLKCFYNLSYMSNSGAFMKRYRSPRSRDLTQMCSANNNFQNVIQFKDKLQEESPLKA